MRHSIEQLRSYWIYNPETGVFRRRVTGEPVGSVLPNGYCYLTIDGKKYLAHRVAVAFMTGAWPIVLVDHRNLRKADNRWRNLRQATNRQNQANRRVRKDSRTGLKGVYWHRAGKKWAAKVYREDGSRKHLGLFNCPAAAHFAYVVGAAVEYGDFSRGS